MRLISLVAAFLSTALLAFAVAAGSGGGTPPACFVDERKLPFAAIPGATAQWGVHAGAGYRVEVPANWNGDLVVWAHGFRGTGLDLTVDNHPLRPLLISQGYAWASSSYSRNDYDVSVGVKDTHALVQLFTTRSRQGSRLEGIRAFRTEESEFYQFSAKGLISVSKVQVLRGWCARYQTDSAMSAGFAK